MLEAVILAAGKGSRLRRISKATPKFLANIRGRPLVYYAASLLESIGVERINIVVPGGWVRKAMKMLGRFDFAAEINFIENYEVDRENGYSFLLARKEIKSKRFILTMCDHLFSKRTLMRFLQGASEFIGANVVIGGDRSPRFINVDEATKILANRSKKVLKIGKELKKFNYIDMGLFIMRRRVFEIIGDMPYRRYVLKLSDLITELIKRGATVTVAEVTGGIWTEIDTPEDYLKLHYGERKIVLRSIEEAMVSEVYVEEH